MTDPTRVAWYGTILSRRTPFEIPEAWQQQVYALKPQEFLAPQVWALFAIFPLALLLKRTILGLSAQPSKKRLVDCPEIEALARAGETPRRCGL
jgi:hypothetical protein